MNGASDINHQENQWPSMVVWIKTHLKSVVWSSETKFKTFVWNTSLKKEKRRTSAEPGLICQTLSQQHFHFRVNWCVCVHVMKASLLRAFLLPEQLNAASLESPDVFLSLPLQSAANQKRRCRRVISIQQTQFDSDNQWRRRNDVPYRPDVLDQKWTHTSAFTRKTFTICGRKPCYLVLC